MYRRISQSARVVILALVSAQTFFSPPLGRKSLALRPSNFIYKSLEQTDQRFLERQNETLQLLLELEVKNAALHMAIIHHESYFDPIQVSKKGAVGLYQIMPKTARELGISPISRDSPEQLRIKLEHSKSPAIIDGRADPRQNVRAGLLYYNRNLARFSEYQNATQLAILSHNAGPTLLEELVKTTPHFDQVLSYFHKNEAWQFYQQVTELNVLYDHALLRNQVPIPNANNGYKLLQVQTSNAD